MISMSTASPSVEKPSTGDLDQKNLADGISVISAEQTYVDTLKKAIAERKASTELALRPGNRVENNTNTTFRLVVEDGDGNKQTISLEPGKNFQAYKDPRNGFTPIAIIIDPGQRIFMPGPGGKLQSIIGANGAEDPRFPGYGPSGTVVMVSGINPRLRQTPNGSIVLDGELLSNVRQVKSVDNPF